MPRPNEQADEAPRARGVRPGKFSALLQELVRSPIEQASSWDRDLKQGAIIGRFELIRELGRGGFGIVYEAKDRELGRHVAFKAVRTGGHRDVRDERLLLEAEAAARLSHPNIVTLYDVGRSEQGPYLVLELLEGETLAQRLAQGTLPVREALRTGVAIAKAVAHAHVHGVVHRDLKPENVFLCHDGQVKVLDFGLAHAFGRRRVEGGTPAYMAPEQVEGAPEDERTDVFALGVILFEMLSGMLPFEDERALRSRPRAPVLDVPGEPAMGDLVARMLEKNPVGRPRDGGEVLTALSAFASELDRAPQPAGPVRTRNRARGLRTGWIAAGIGIAVGIAGAGAWWAKHRINAVAHSEPSQDGPVAPLATRPGAAATPSIAVLPFADMSPGKDQEYFSDGIAEEILNALAQVEGLHVTGRTSSFAFKGKNEDLRTIGQRLNVSTILEGSVRKDGPRVRITAEIVNVTDGYRVWSKTFDRALTGIFEAQDEIARAVVQVLEVKLLPGIEPTTKRSSTSYPEAHTQYLIGEYLVRTGATENTRRAVTALEKALAIDPAYAPARTFLANALGNLALRTRGEEGEDLRRRALDASNKAVEVGPDYGYAYSVRGWLRAVMNWDWVGAQADLERAVALSPGDPLIRNGYGILLEKQGRLAQALAQVQKSVDIDPLNSVHWGNLAGFLMEVGNFASARDAFGRALGISPENSFAAYDLAVLDLLDGHPAAALSTFEREPDEALRLRGIAIAQHTLGHTRESDRALGDLVARAGGRASYEIAIVHAWRGERDHAFDWLERAYAQHDIGLRNLKIDPLLRGLHGDARFTALLRKMRLPTE